MRDRRPLGERARRDGLFHRRDPRRRACGATPHRSRLDAHRAARAPVRIRPENRPDAERALRHAASVAADATARAGPGGRGRLSSPRRRDTVRGDHPRRATWAERAYRHRAPRRADVPRASPRVDSGARHPQGRYVRPGRGLASRGALRAAPRGGSIARYLAARGGARVAAREPGPAGARRRSRLRADPREHGPPLRPLRRAREAVRTSRRSCRRKPPSRRSWPPAMRRGPRTSCSRKETRGR